MISIKFIHSLQTFKQRLCKWDYSEALSTPAQPNNVVLSFITVAPMNMEYYATALFS